MKKLIKKSILLVGLVMTAGLLTFAQGPPPEPRRRAQNRPRRLAGDARPQPRRRLGRNRPHREVGAERRELPVARAVRRPLGADRDGQSRLRAEPVGPRRRAAGARDGARRRHRARSSGNTSSTSFRATCRRIASAGRRRPPIPRPATSTRCGVGAEVIALSKDGKLLWERSIGEEFAAFTTHGGRTMSPIIDGDLVIVSAAISNWGTAANRVASLHRARQAHRRHRLRRQPGRPPVRHGLRDAAHRDDQRHAAADRRHSATAASTRSSRRPARRCGASSPPSAPSTPASSSRATR